MSAPDRCWVAVANGVPYAADCMREALRDPIEYVRGDRLATVEAMADDLAAERDRLLALLHDALYDHLGEHHWRCVDYKNQAIGTCVCGLAEFEAAASAALEGYEPGEGR